MTTKTSWSRDESDSANEDGCCSVGRPPNRTRLLNAFLRSKFGREGFARCQIRSARIAQVQTPSGRSAPLHTQHRWRV